MSELHTRKEKRTPVTLKIKFKSATLDQFIERYSVDVSHGGIFIRTKDPLAVGTQLRFEFQLQDASPLISGDGTVVWTREFDPSRVGVAPGMGVRFDRLAPESQPVLEQILSRKAGGAPSRELDRFEAASNAPGSEKTRITPPTLASSLAASSRLPSAPAQPVRAGLAGLVPPRAGFGDEQSKNDTPLPKPMPFHVGGEDEFSEDVFDQPTKVASLEVLLRHEEEHARQAQAEALAAAAAAVRQKSVVAQDADEDEQTEVVPKPAGERHRSPRPEIHVVPPMAEAPLIEALTPRHGTPRPMPTRRQPSIPPVRAESVEGPMFPAAPLSAAASGPAPSIHEPRFLEGGRPHVHVASDLIANSPPRPRPAASTERTAAKRSSPIGIILGAAVLVAAAAAVYFLVIKPSDEEAAPPPRPADRVSQEPATGPRNPEIKPAPAGTPAPKVAKGKLVLAATPVSAHLAIDGAAAAPVPTDVELDAGKHQLAFSAPCHKDETVTVDVTADQVKEVSAKLKPLDRVVRVTTDPAGASLIVDGKAAGKTPTDVRLVGKLDPNGEHTFVFRKPGFDEAQTVVPPDAACATDGDVAVVGLSMTLTAAAAPKPRPAPEPVRAAPRVAPRPSPPKTEPVKMEPVRIAPLPREEPKAEPPKAAAPPKETAKEEPKAEAVKAEPPPPKESAKEEPKAEPIRAKPEPAKPEATKPEPAKPEPAKPEPAKPDCDPSPDAPEWARCK